VLFLWFVGTVSVFAVIRFPPGGMSAVRGAVVFLRSV